MKTKIFMNGEEISEEKLEETEIESDFLSRILSRITKGGEENGNGYSEAV